MINKIHTDKEQIHADILLYRDLTYQIRGCIFTVYNGLGYGHKENVYQKALEKEFKINNVPFEREKILKVKFKGEPVGRYIPDFIVGNKVILEIKAVEFMPKSYQKQLLNYLKTTDINLGLLVNFGASKLYIKRLIWTDRHGGNQ